MNLDPTVISEINQSLKKTEVNLELLNIADLSQYIPYLEQVRNLKVLSLHGNCLKELPAQIANLTQLEQLDISRNKFNDILNLIQKLEKLPSLKRLKFLVKKEKEKFIVGRLKNLTSINGTKVVREIKKKQFIYKYLNTEKMGELFNNIKGKMKSVQKFEETYLQENNEEDNDKIYKELQDLMDDAMHKAHPREDEEGSITENLEFLFYCLTEFEMYDLVKSRALNVCIDIYGDLGKMLKELSDHQDKIFKNVFEISLKLVKYEEEFIHQEESKKFSGNFAYENKVLQRNAFLEKEIRRIKRMKDELQNDMTQIQHENKRYLQMFVKLSKEEKTSYPSLQFSRPTQQTSRKISPPPFQKERSRTPVRQSKTMINFSAESSKILSLKQMKDTIEEIYVSKVKFDSKNMRSKLPRETMNQFLFTFLNHKYGLKNLTIEAAKSIVSGVEAYEAKDNGVAVFGKILRNEIEEEFHNNQKELKNQINKLVKMQIKGKNPYKNGRQLDEIYEEKRKGDITFEQAKDIVQFLFEKSDSDIILRKVSSQLNFSQQKIGKSQKAQQDFSFNDMKKKKISLSTFSQIVLNFYLRKRKLYLRPLASVFKSRDRNNDGILNEEEFSSLVEQICGENENSKKLLKIIDPHNNKSITFSEVVELVESYPEKNPILKVFFAREGIIIDESDY